MSVLCAVARREIENALRPIAAAVFLSKDVPPDEQNAIIKAELETERRLDIAGGKLAHKAISYDDATGEQKREAQALAALRALGEIQREANQAIREAIELIHKKYGTKAITLAEASGLSNGTTSRWIREFREEDAKQEN